MSLVPPAISRTANARLGQLGGLAGGQAGDDPVDRAQLGRVGGRVDQQGQAEVPRPGAVPGRLTALLKLQVGGVAVVPVGDQRRPRGQVGGDLGQLGRVGDGPQPVPDAVRGPGLRQRRPVQGGLGHDPGGGAGAVAAAAGMAVVEQEDRLQVGLGGLHQRQPPGHRARRHGLVRLHDPGLAGDQLHRADQAALQPVRLAVLTRRKLLVHVQGGLGVGHQYPVGQPLLAGRPRRRPTELPGWPAGCRGRMIRTTLCGSAASNWSSFSLAMTSYGGEVTSASPLTRASE